MNIFVTGGAGYIGGALTRKLIDEGHGVTVYDSLITGHKKSIPSGVIFEEGEIGDREKVSDLFSSNDYDVLIHLAASVNVRESMAAPEKYFRNNLMDSLNLIEMAQKFGINKVIFSSSYSIYKASKELFKEDSAIEPSNVYSYTKFVIEQSLEWYNKIYGMKVAILRLPNAAGALQDHGEDHDPEPHLIPRVLNVAEGKLPEFEIFGNNFPTPDGTAVRDFVHIKDIASAMLIVLNSFDNRSYMKYNVSTGKGASINEIIEICRKITGLPIPVKYLSAIEGESPSLVSSSEKIREELQWVPEFSDITEIIQTFWNWRLSHPQGNK